MAGTLGIAKSTSLSGQDLGLSPPIEVKSLRSGSTAPAGSADGKKGNLEIRDEDADCPFRHSSLYRSIYVYPTYNDTLSGWTRDSPLLSERGRSGSLKPWPWLEVDAQTRKDGSGHYDVTGQMGQYTLEHIVRYIMTHPRSCLKTDDPANAKLFYVPYLPSTEFHKGRVYADGESYRTTPFAQAVHDAIEGKYDGWENEFGLTSKYWKRRSGADHILVFSEPLHGLGHPRNRRGSHHFIHTQRQLRPPIIISIELSTTFVNMYPKCASKNIVSPYPNPDGRWYNGHFDREALNIREKNNLGDVAKSNAALKAEKELVASHDGGSNNATANLFDHPRPLTHFYNAGRHGTCTNVRVALKNDLKCSPSVQALEKAGGSAGYFQIAMQLATFCPCPGGDSPSAKRMFDAILAGCIPIIMSEDFVWPFSNETDGRSERNPNDYSIRWKAKDWVDRRLDDKCQRKPDAKDGGFSEAMEGISADEILRLRKGVKAAADFYSFYRRSEGKFPDNPLQEGILPDGGGAHEIVKELEKRAWGQRWAACEAELKRSEGKRKTDPKQFLC
eukprot:CAMPEP_0113542308 /NCGR_PEP_ID=MMETSP0015_2-20120614/9533_1 /TAXON_ID=2838 /ORGANISM="Odontella" /LENGTH=558 /DNA_ID=CAMNT_0000442347 /DNA_START=122 /DNA_END=1798 /DNA_ORIENTATION=- /assembly_acc=CAM_ASM_000160